VNSDESGLSGATDLVERADPQRADEGPKTTASLVTVYATWALTAREFLKQISIALDIVKPDEPGPADPRSRTGRRCAIPLSGGTSPAVWFRT